jgi:hypothetical protein
MPDPATDLALRAALKPAGLDNAASGSTVHFVNSKTLQHFSICARLQLAPAVAWYIRLCPERPGAAS